MDKGAALPCERLAKQNNKLAKQLLDKHLRASPLSDGEKQQYQVRLEQLTQQVEAEDVQLKQHWSLPDNLEFTRQPIKQTDHTDMSADAMFMSHGCGMGVQLGGKYSNWKPPSSIAFHTSAVVWAEQLSISKHCCCIVRPLRCIAGVNTSCIHFCISVPFSHPDSFFVTYIQISLQLLV